MILFHYDPGRSGKVAETVVGNFEGFLQTDGYAGYDALGSAKASSTSAAWPTCVANSWR